MENGCTTCRCNDVDPCKCDPATKPTDVRTCPDGTQIKYTDVCYRNEKGVCGFLTTKCPFVISVTTKGELTEADLAVIKEKIGVSYSGDITVTKMDNMDGTFTTTFKVEQDGLVPGKTADDVNKDVSDGAKEKDPNAVALVVSDGNVVVPAKSFAKILLPVLSFFLMLLF